MTDDRTLERAARSWLEEGPTRAPDRPVEAALARIQTTRQERDLGIPWRVPKTYPTVRIAAIALVALVTVGGIYLASRPASNLGLPTPTPSPTATETRNTATSAPTEDALAAYKASRNAICAGFAAASPIPEVPDWAADPAAAADFVAAAIARGEDEVAALEAMAAPPSIAAEHAANVQTGKDTLAVLEHEHDLLLQGKVADALAVDAATGPLNQAFEAFEIRYQLTACV